jgi:predicted lysophospholipase L1 biosynthesis ABC-type transport system permease subunit
MEAIRQTQKKYGSAALSFAIITGFIFYLVGLVPICKGLILGTLFSILNFVLMGETLPMRIDRSKGRVFVIALGSIFFRYVLLAIPIVMAIRYEIYDLFAVIIGIFMVQLTLLSDHLLILIKERFRKTG